MLNLLLLLKNWKTIAVLILIGLVGFGAWHYQHTLKENAKLEAELTLQQTTVDALIEQHEKDVAALTMVIEQEKKRKEETQHLIEEIQNAPQSEDGPIAPVLRNTLDRLLN